MDCKQRVKGLDSRSVNFMIVTGLICANSLHVGIVTNESSIGISTGSSESPSKAPWFSSPRSALVTMWKCHIVSCAVTTVMKGDDGFLWVQFKTIHLCPDYGSWYIRCFLFLKHKKDIVVLLLPLHKTANYKIVLNTRGEDTYISESMYL